MALGVAKRVVKRDENGNVVSDCWHFVQNPHKQESEIFEDIRSLDKPHVCLLTGSSVEKRIFNMLQHADWVDNSEDTDHPPDYYNSTIGAMIEFMQVNDYETLASNGHVHNASADAGSKEFRKLQKEGYFDHLSENVMMAYFEYDDSGMKPVLGTYFSNFCRTVDKHSKKVNSYHSNHVDCPFLMFGVCDTSENEHLIQDLEGNIKGYYHPCVDIKFLRKIKSLPIDALLWYSPYLAYPGHYGAIPALVIIDVKTLVPEQYFMVMGECDVEVNGDED